MRLHKVTLRIEPDLCWLMACLLLIVPVKWLMGWFLAVILHESGHFLALELCKAPVTKITFGLRGALMNTRELTDREMLICATAGPLSGILAAFAVKYYFPFSVCSFALSVLNLIPIPGRDGDKILLSFLRIFFDDDNASSLQRGIRGSIIFFISFATIWFLSL